MAFSGQVVLVTGASSGIGAATAKHFAGLDASLALTGRNLENLKRVSAECKTISSKEPFFFIADLDVDADRESLIKSVITHFKGLDVLVNNAGIGVIKNTIENTSLDDYDKVFSTNVRAVYHLTMLAVPTLIERKGVIVNVSSIRGLRAHPERLAYGMAKAALDQFTRCVALELAPKGVRLNVVNPGVIKTRVFHKLGMSVTEIGDFFEQTKMTYPLGTAGLPEEVAKAICFLASDDSSFSTGVNLVVDGGCILG